VSGVEIIEPERGERGKWLTSGNPGVFTREHRDLLKLFRDKCPDAANVLYDIMMDPKAPYTVRAFCAANWIDRALGKPRQSVEVEQQGRTLEQLLEAVYEARRAERAANAETIDASATPDLGNELRGQVLDIAGEAPERRSNVPTNVPTFARTVVGKHEEIQMLAPYMSGPWMTRTTILTYWSDGRYTVEHLGQPLPRSRSLVVVESMLPTSSPRPKRVR